MYENRRLNYNNTLFHKTSTKFSSNKYYLHIIESGYNLYEYIFKGSDFGPNVRKWMDGGRPANLGQCFVAVNPECFAPGFELRMCDMMCTLRNMEPVSILCTPDTTVLFTFFVEAEVVIEPRSIS